MALDVILFGCKVSGPGCDGTEKTRLAETSDSSAHWKALTALGANLILNPELRLFL